MEADITVKIVHPESIWIHYKNIVHVRPALTVDLDHQDQRHDLTKRTETVQIWIDQHFQIVQEQD